MALGFYSFDDLSKQTDILTFLESHTGNTRGFYNNGSFQICSAGAANLRTQIDADIVNAQKTIGNDVRTTTPSSTQIAAAGWTAMPIAFQYLTSVSVSAKDLLMLERKENEKRALGQSEKWQGI